MDDPDNIYYFSELLENNDENMNTIVGVVSIFFYFIFLFKNKKIKK